MPSPIEHEALIAAVAQERDRDAFARLFDWYAPRLTAYLLRQGAEQALAEEIVQDAMVTLWRKAEMFDPAKSSLTTWLYRIARNRRIDLMRRDRSTPVEPDSPLFEVVDDTDLEGELDASQREAAVREAMRSLPEEQLALVRLAFFEALSHSEIAERTGLPLGTVKSRIRLAFTRLRRTLESGGVVEAQ
ncbi:sigma-70 family RNA polymerase sigma factor [Salinarimonas sp. NSM]|uniref:sigma-70 family RNA polymerase sigma factor n=1 Tax=Salinarimonas sp. NSM TaxID=3458003 RepID=UPI0040369528